MDAWRKPSSPTFYPIVDVELCRARGLSPRAVAEACLAGGARWLQLRAKAAGGAAFVELADAVVRAAGAEALVIVNDRVDVALMAGAAGVHVGQDDLPVEAARRLLGARAVVGVSTHDDRQVEAALATSADYLAVGPIYGTRTKDTGYGARGLDLLRRAAGRGRPVAAIGGITLERAPEVAAAGAALVAVIADLLDEPIDARVRAFVRALA